MEFLAVTEGEERKELAALAHEIWNEYFPCILEQGQIDYMVEKFQSHEAISRQISEEGYRYFLLREEGDTARLCRYLSQGRQALPEQALSEAPIPWKGPGLAGIRLSRGVLRADGAAGRLADCQPEQIPMAIDVYRRRGIGSCASRERRSAAAISWTISSWKSPLLRSKTAC